METSAHSLPSQFGRCTAISCEHGRLAQKLAELERVCGALEVERSAQLPLLVRYTAASAVLSGLRQQLLDHFADEESDDYFGAIAREQPSLIPRIADLRAGHNLIMEVITELCAVATGTRNGKELPLGATRLSALIRAHESDERAVIQEFLLGQ